MCCCIPLLVLKGIDFTVYVLILSRGRITQMEVMIFWQTEVAQGGLFGERVQPETEEAWPRCRGVSRKLFFVFLIRGPVSSPE